LLCFGDLPAGGPAGQSPPAGRSDVPRMIALVSLPGSFNQLLRPPARALTALVGVWALFAACAMEFYAWRYEAPSDSILARVAVLAAVAGGCLLFRRWRGQAAAVRRVGIVAAIVIGALAVRFFAVNLLHAMLVSGLLTIGLLGAWALARAPAPRRVRRSLVALLLATLHFILFAYYVVLFIGRETWHEVVSRELIVAYLPHIADLVAILPVSPWIPYGSAAIAYLVFLTVYLAFSGRICESLAGDEKRMPLHAAVPARVAATAFLAGIVCAVSSPAAGDWLFRSFVTDYRDPLTTTLLVSPTPLTVSGKLRLVPNALNLTRDRQIAASYPAPERTFTKTIVLITVDALRPDQMGVYGHARDNTPFLTRLHREGRLVRVDNAFSTCALSICGLIAIHASKYWHQLAEQNFTLADVLKRLGYRSHFLLGGDHTNHYGLRTFYGAGVDEFRDSAQAHRYNDDQQVVEWVADLPPRDGTPRFLFTHLMSAHFMGVRHPQYKRWQPVTPSVVELRRPGISAEIYANHYHDGILQADGMIERIFAHLREKGLLDDAIVIITADHGELLGEGGRFGHGSTLRDPAVRVPLLIYDTVGHPYPPRELASILDVAPTLLDRIGAPIPAHWTGESLARPGARRFVFLQGGEGHAVIGRFGTELFKHYHHREKRTDELFNLSRDPGEEHPLSPSAHADVVAALRAELAPLVAVDSKRVRE
jgi:arylsulfatase A-like enzyme